MIAQAWKLARRELRGGIAGFRVFLLCLALGVAAIAAVASVREAIEAGLAEEGATILGGDAEIAFTYRFASDEEQAFMADIADQVSETVDFRSMLRTDRDGEIVRGLTQVRGIDDLYPLVGAVTLEPALSLQEALAENGIVADPILIGRMGLEIGDQVQLGTTTLTLRAALTRTPDAAGDGFALGPRSLVSLESLASSGLLEPGTLFDSNYRLTFPTNANLAALEAEALTAFENTGLRWRDTRNAAPGLSQFVDRIGSFLVLIGLSGLAVGGIGVASAVSDYLRRKTPVIATLKTVGAETRLIRTAYLLQIGVLAVIGITAGLVLGAGLPYLAAPFIEARLPIALSFLGLSISALGEAAFYGFMTALLFTLWPLAQIAHTKATVLYRDDDAVARRPSTGSLAVIIAVAAAFIAIAAWLSGIALLALYTLGGIVGAIMVLALAAWGIKTVAKRLARSRWIRGRTPLRLALAAIGGAKGGAVSTVLSLGLGLTVLATVGQVDANLRSAIENDLPENAPAYFFVDIQNDQLPGFLSGLEATNGVTRIDHAPMLRGIITQINGEDARSVAGDHWVLNGDRGVTYSERPSDGTTLTDGEWWPEGYTGAPQISFAAEEAAEMGIGVGDLLTVNILGRDIEGEITSLREVDFSNAGIGFILSFSPNALAGAPHTHIATVYADEAAELPLLESATADAPNITAIRVRDGIELVSNALAGFAAATSLGASATLLTGFVVLIGAAAAGERNRVFEAAVLKTLGASRRSILLSFAIRSAILGAAAGIVAIFAAVLGAWSVMRFVMEASYTFEPVSAFLIIIGGALAVLLANLAFLWKPLTLKPSTVLRATG